MAVAGSELRKQAIGSLDGRHRVTDTKPDVFAREVNDAAFCELKIALTLTTGDVRTGARERGRHAHQDIAEALAAIPIPRAGSFEEVLEAHAQGRKIIMPEMPLVSEKLGMRGRPDLLIWGERLDAFEFKTGSGPKRPSRRLGARAFESDAAQALAYGLLLEEQFGVVPSLWIVYAEEQVLADLRSAAIAWGLDPGEVEHQLARCRPVPIPFTDRNRVFVEELIARARAIKADPQVAHRSHEIAGRCSGCAFRDTCLERLA